MSLESLTKDKQLKATIKEVIRGSGRSYPVGGNEESAGTSSEKKQVPTRKETPLTAVSKEKEALAVH